jgi:hypothetical protein
MINSMKQFIYLFLLFSIVLTSCKKETFFVYEVDPVTAQKDKNGKGIPKSTVEFISIAYADVFGTTISQNDLGKLSLLYLAFGDKRLIEDLLVKNMLNSASVQIISNTSMRADIPAFVNSIYQRIYNREPNELEAFTLAKSISDDTSLSPVVIYYSMMTSDEYRYY